MLCFKLMSLCFFSASVTGSVISSTVLRQPPNEIDDEILGFCGANDCPGNNASNPNTEKPDEQTVRQVNLFFWQIPIKVIFSDESGQN